MKRLAIAVVVLAVAICAGAARAAGTFSVAPDAVTAGTPVTVTFCGFAAGQAGYYTVNGPSVSSTRFWGPANGADCLTYSELTGGWAAGKYKFIAFVSTSTGRASRVGSAVVTVSAP